MKKKSDFVNIAGNAFNTITDNLIDREYEINVSAASAALNGGKRANQMTQHPVAAERIRFISLFLSILYLPAVHPQGREDDAGVFSFIN